MQPHAAPAPPMPQMEMDEPPNKKARGKFPFLFTLDWTRFKYQP